MQWIWLDRAAAGDYAEFTEVFAATEGEAAAATLTAGADWEYAVYINGAFAAGGQYADPAGEKSVDTVDVSRFLHSGENELRMIAYHMGGDYQVCRTAQPCAAFCVRTAEKVLAESDEHTRCRRYAAIYAEQTLVTPQLGLGWGYDFTRAEEPWQKATVVEPNFTVRERPNKLFTRENICPAKVCAQGVYREADGVTAAERMQNAWLSARRFADMTELYRVGNDSPASNLTFSAQGGDGVYIVVDLGRETAGYLQLCVTVPKDCNAMLGWGEHLADLRLRTAVGGRNFGAFMRLRAGKNELRDDMHRLGCRYLCLFAATDGITVERLTLAEAMYPFADLPKDWGDRLLNEIYAAGKRTLSLCAHVHYEDCPWREQALYGMDSRNQMLFGYGVFGEYELPRASIRDILDSIADDGLPELCPPARNSITIPVFALYTVLALGENARVDYNEAFVRWALPLADKMMEVFSARLYDDGVHCFTAKRYWNFYEWVEGLSGGAIFRDGEIPETSDAILTAIFALAAKEMMYLFSREGDAEKAAAYTRLANAAAKSLDKFYDKHSGLYASFIDSDGNRTGLHGYTQAAILLATELPPARAKDLVHALKELPSGMADCTFATLQLKYDALMRYGDNRAYCLNEICRVFGGMLSKGATSYWETEPGEADFGDAGSLCHAWSAVPCYFMDKYL